VGPVRSFVEDVGDLVGAELVAIAQVLGVGAVADGEVGLEAVVEPRLGCEV
jgi:hypothetical protein